MARVLAFGAYDLGKYTKQGSSLLTMGLIGGAVITVLFGLIKISQISDMRIASAS